MKAMGMTKDRKFMIACNYREDFDMVRVSEKWDFAVNNGILRGFFFEVIKLKNLDKNR